MLTIFSACGIILAIFAAVSHSGKISGSSEKPDLERLYEPPENLPRKTLPEQS
jgi:hypothetical protein